MQSTYQLAAPFLVLNTPRRAAGTREYGILSPVRVLRDADTPTRQQLSEEFDTACDLFIEDVRMMQRTRHVLTSAEYQKIFTALAALIELHDFLETYEK